MVYNFFMESSLKKVILKSKKTLAFDSPDHLEPFGTRRDNSKNVSFNQKLYRLWGGKKWLNILDLGCSGGGFVKDCFDEGHLAVGLEGSDYSKKIGRAEWRTIPEYLFTCDITKDFNLFLKDNKKEEKILFNVITMWDVIEHIAEKDLFPLAENIKNNLSKDGVWILSVGCEEDIINGVRLHQTVRPERWWRQNFRKMGFVEVPKYKKYFRNQWIKGKYKYENGFNICLTLPKNSPPKVPKQGIKEKLFDYWADSKLQINIRRILFGYIENRLC